MHYLIYCTILVVIYILGVLQGCFIGEQSLSEIVVVLQSSVLDQCIALCFQVCLNVVVKCSNMKN